ncbi:MAG: 2-oxoacid:acceptor oxidoreductase subunit alpha [Patescibacteria group bacterium]
MALSWKISGEAGFGITTIGLTFAKMLARHGLQVWTYAEYPSLIRGGFTTCEITIDEVPNRALKPNLDMLICLMQDGFDRDAHRVTQNTIVIYDKDVVSLPVDTKGIHIPVPYKDIKLRNKAPQVMVNTVSIGVTMAIFGKNLDSFDSMVAEEFSRKGDEVVEFNKKLAKEGWDYAVSYINENRLSEKISSLINTNLKELDKKTYDAKASDNMVLTGNDAFTLGSMLAGIKAYLAYPMSPASTVLSTLAAWAKKNDIVVRHTEDEIAAINEALGFSYAGVRTSVGTSGGGFALMVEAISYAGVAELPIVMYLVQRPGPATGLPTWTGQGDLLFTVHAGHGEFMKIVLAAGDYEEMLEIASDSYNIADVLQTPVIVMADKLLGESYASVSKKWFDELSKKYKKDRGQVVEKTSQAPYLRYKDSPDGISEYLIPGLQKGVFWQANSYEHFEDSHTTEDAGETIKQVNKRAKKVDTYLKSKYYKLPKIYGDIEKSDVTIVSYGSNKSAILAAIDTLTKMGKSVSYVHFTHLYPLDIEKVQEILSKAKKLIFVENGSKGQLPMLLGQEGILKSKYEKLLKFDGRPILQEEIVSFISNL